MNKKIFLFALAVATISFTACNKTKKTESTDNTVTTEVADMHNAQNAIDWEGSYFGVLPCASCPGINTLISLDDDSTFVKTVEYLNSDDTPETIKGKFSWDSTGNIITIGDNTYQIGENQLFSLDKDNKKIEGELAENYILSKVNMDPAPNANDGFSKMEFNGSDNKEYDVVFNTNPKTPVAFIEIDDTYLVLTQTESWAKGAIYATKNMKLTAEGDKATLEINGKKIELKKK